MTDVLTDAINTALDENPQWVTVDELADNVQQRLSASDLESCLRKELKQRVRHCVQERRGPDGKRAYESVERGGKREYRQLALFERGDFVTVIKHCKRQSRFYQLKANRMARLARQKGFQLRLPFPGVTETEAKTRVRRSSR